MITKMQSFQNSIQMVYFAIPLFLSEMLFCRWLKYTRTEWLKIIEMFGGSIKNQ